MSKISTAGMLGLVLSLCSARADLRATPQADSPTFEGKTTAKDAAALEEGLRTKPDNQAAREKLIDYYFREGIRSRTSEPEEKREEHVFWLIEHHPESEFAGSPEAGILPMGFTGSIEGYQRGKQLWLEAVVQHADDAAVLRNAAQFLNLVDAKVARNLLEKTLALQPNDAEASSMLAESYEHERMRADSPEEKEELSRKAVSIRERGLESADAEQRFYELADLATSAYEAGDTVKAQQYAFELLASADSFKKNWNYGNAVHKGNIILGRVALGRGDITSAKEHLLAAGQTPGSPQLDSFGPNMTLAKELLEKGEREVVLTYLDACAKFWKMGGDQLQSWMAMIKGGGMPEFGGNLLY